MSEGGLGLTLKPHTHKHTHHTGNWYCCASVELLMRFYLREGDERKRTKEGKISRKKKI